MKVNNHNFVNHKSEEMICWQCGYVIWRCDIPEKALEAIEMLTEDRYYIAGKKNIKMPRDFYKTCPEKWHGWNYKDLENG